MSRSPAESLRALLLALAAAGMPAGAQEPPAPADVRNPSLTTGSVSFADGSVSFTGGSVNFTEGSVSLPTSTVARPAEQSGTELRFELTADLLFDFDKADLRPEAEGLLRDVVAQIKAKAKRPSVRVEGHTDSKGSDAYNQDLSERRSASVKGWLVQRGKLPTKSVAALGFGEHQPVAANEKPDGSDDPEGRQKNRRVEIVVTGLR
jgi:outer membrane protein OmpA-like peptidoglycan-associated protein